MSFSKNKVPDWRSIENSRPSNEDRGTSTNSDNTRNLQIKKLFTKETKTYSNYRDLREKIAHFAHAELQWWQNGPNGRRIVETTPAGMTRITSYWNNVPGASAHNVPATAWSAVFVSTCVKLAADSLKLKPMPLRLSEAHFRYAKAAYYHRSMHPSFPGYYWAYASAERVVQVGDIIIKERPGLLGVYHGLTFRDLAIRDGAISHGDIVTAIQSNGRATVVGGNVRSSVTQGTYILTPTGKIDTTNTNNSAIHVFAILSIPAPQELQEQSYPPIIPNQDMLNDRYV